MRFAGCCAFNICSRVEANKNLIFPHPLQTQRGELKNLDVAHALQPAGATEENLWYARRLKLK
jgi:hypothetical protein